MAHGAAEGVLERDGSFRFRMPAENLDVLPGDYVQIISTQAGAAQFLGQVEETAVEFVLETDTTVSTQTVASLGDRGPDTISTRKSRMVPRGLRDGTGRVLAGLREGDHGLAALADFDLHGHTGGIYLSEAPDEAVDSFVAQALAKEGPILRVGALLGVSKPVVARLIADGFKRPTGLFGQSGSGKSHALGIIVEELILHTIAKVVILDPNGDFVRFRDPLRGLDEVNRPSSTCTVTASELAAYSELHKQKVDHTVVLSADESVQGKTPISVRPSDLDVREVAAVLSLDAATNPEEYSVLGWVWGALEEPNGERYTLKDLREQLEQVEFRAKGETKWAAALLLRRLGNARLEQLSIWGAADDVPLVSLLRDEDVQAVVVDLSTLDNLEKALVSSLVFRTVWDLQGDRRREGVAKCSVLVLDEAHYMFPRNVILAEQGLTVDWGAKIAGEGRKYGVYLVAASQLPSKLHEYVLTQFGNVIVMKMSSQSDISAVQDSLSFIPGTLLERAKWFDQGDALVIGDIVPAPSCLLHFEGRKTHEGGRDLRVDWGEAGGGEERLS